MSVSSATSLKLNSSLTPIPSPEIHVLVGPPFRRIRNEIGETVGGDSSPKTSLPVNRLISSEMTPLDEAVPKRFVQLIPCLLSSRNSTSANKDSESEEEETVFRTNVDNPPSSLDGRVVAGTGNRIGTRVCFDPEAVVVEVVEEEEEEETGRLSGGGGGGDIRPNMLCPH